MNAHVRALYNMEARSGVRMRRGAEHTWTIVDPHASCPVVGVAEVRWALRAREVQVANRPLVSWRRVIVPSRIDLPDGGEQIDTGNAAAGCEPALEFRIAKSVCVEQCLYRHVPWNGTRAFPVIVATRDDPGTCCDVHVAWSIDRTVIRRASAGLAEERRRIPG